jgi:phospholipid/cholesterol/gamma-HCH transport system permease protein
VTADAGDRPSRSSRTSLAPPPIGGLEPRPPLAARIAAMVEQLGEVALLTGRTVRALGKRPYEIRALLYQMESLGVQSTGIVATTSIFIGMVMTIQFAFGLQRFGGLEYIPRVIVLSFLRELGPTLTAIIVGGRIGSGMAAEVGAMNVTEQVDAIRALGADPHKKLVLPRVLAAILVMPVLSLFSIFLGVIGAMLVCQFQYGIPFQFFLRSSLQVVQMADLFSGLGKTPVFGFIIAITGCHFGLRTSGGTEGVGRSTTRTVVVVSIAILIADFLLTKIFVAFLPP